MLTWDNQKVTLTLCDLSNVCDKYSAARDIFTSASIMQNSAGSLLCIIFTHKSKARNMEKAKRIMWSSMIRLQGGLIIVSLSPSLTAHLVRRLVAFISFYHSRDNFIQTLKRRESLVFMWPSIDHINYLLSYLAGGWIHSSSEKSCLGSLYGCVSTDRTQVSFNSKLLLSKQQVSDYF